MSEKKRTIMIGFHSPVDGRLMREWVTGLGYDVVESLDDTAGIDLVLMDSVTARRLMGKAFGLKRAAKYFLPILVCINAGENVGRWLKAGFDDVLRLPATKGEWQARIDIMLRLRGQSEELGQKSEYLHRALIESSGDHIFLLDPNGAFVTSNDRVAHFGLDRGAQLVGRTIEQVFPKTVAPFYREQVQRVLTEGKTVVFEHDLPSDRATHYHLDTLYPIKLPDGTVMVGGICRDITGRKLAEKQLHEAEWFARSTLDSLSAHIAILDADGIILAVNRSWWRFAETNGPVRGNVCEGANYLAVCDAAQGDDQSIASEFAAGIHRVLSGEAQEFALEYPCHSPDKQRWFIGRVTRFAGEGPVSVVVSHKNITERKQAEEARQVLETAINNAQECIMVSDRENRLTYVNRTFEKLTGYSAAEALGNTPGMLKSGQHDRAFYRNLKKTIYSGHPWEGNITLRKKNGDYYDVYATITPVLDESGTPMHFVSVHRDVTRERELEHRIQQNQRLEAIGTLAGGIAHDFNNLLSPILGYTKLCMDALPAGSEVKEDLEEVVLAAGRATDLVRQILSFSRQSAHERKPIRVASVVKEALKLLRATIPSSIDIHREISGATETVVADPTEIHQMVMNLCTNAFHAMPDGGVLTVTLKAVDLDKDASVLLPDCAPGRYLNLSVEDTGQGIAPEIRDKIFEPYFTTKKEGRGTGLGLAITHSIVAACGGAITVYSEPGKGTRFSLYFPVAEDRPTEVVEKETITGSGHERILFIDDDAVIVELGRRTLERYGYSVTTSMDPVQALELFKKAPADFDMVITDMTMPGMTGDLLAGTLLKLRPDLPVIVCTGFSERMNKEIAAKMGIRRLLGKPITPSTLLSTIREVFDREE